MRLPPGFDSSQMQAAFQQLMSSAGANAQGANSETSPFQAFRRIIQSNPHQQVYFLMIANTLRIASFDMISHTTGLNLQKIIGYLIFASSILAMLNPNDTQFQNLIGKPLQHLLGMLPKITRAIATRLPMMQLNTVPRNTSRLTGKIGSALYLLLLGGIVKSATSDALYTLVNVALPFLKPVDVNHIIALRKSPVAMTLIHSFIGLASLRASGQLSRDLAPQLQELVNKLSNQITVDGSLQWANLLAETVTYTKSNPYEVVYNSTLVLIALQSANELLGRFPTTLVQTVLYLGPMAWPYLSPYASRLPVNTMPRIAPEKLKQAARQISNSSLALTSRSNEPMGKQITQSITFLIMNYYSRDILVGLASRVNYLLLCAACSSFSATQGNGMVHAIQNLVSTTAAEASNEIGYVDGAIGNFLLSLGVVKLLGQAIPVANKKASDLLHLTQLRFSAWWSPGKNIELGDYYLNQNKFAEAILCYRFVPHPGGDIEKLFNHYKASTILYTLDELKAEYGEATYHYLLAQGKIALTQLTKANDKLGRGETDGVQALLDSSKANIIRLTKYPYRVVEWHIAQTRLLTQLGDPKGLQWWLTLLFNLQIENGGGPVPTVVIDNKTNYVHPITITIGGVGYAGLEMSWKESDVTKVISMIQHNLIKHCILASLDLPVPVNADTTAEELKRAAMECKESNNPLFAYIYYDLAAKKLGAPSVFSDRSQQHANLDVKNYYRNLFNCGNMLIKLSEQANHRDLKQSILEKAKGYFETAAQSGTIKGSDKPNAAKLSDLSQKGIQSVNTELQELNQEKREMEFTR